ncbi:hypothetical protein BJ165DRAFT_1482033 [Panaeolus papilionaceus]|nr:hypothetical protein BJ165DRAFT_1482033 [Panaeolus papilionaceus]
MGRNFCMCPTGKASFLDTCWGVDWRLICLILSRIAEFLDNCYSRYGRGDTALSAGGWSQRSLSQYHVRVVEANNRVSDINHLSKRMSKSLFRKRVPPVCVVDLPKASKRNQIHGCLKRPSEVRKRPAYFPLFISNFTRF